MRYCHPDYLKALVERHTIATKAEVLRGGLVAAELAVLDGHADVSRSAEMRRRATVTLGDPDGTLTPRKASDLLAPFGTELRLWRGIRNPAGTNEEGWLHPVATVAISNPKIYDTGDGLTISLDGFDRSRRIRRNPWKDPYPVPAMGYVEAVELVVRDRLPNVEFRAESTIPYNCAPTIFGLDRNVDPWSEITTFVQASGREIGFDAMGVCVLRGVIDRGADQSWRTPVATYAEGTTARNLLAIERDLDETVTYSRVLVISENSTSDTQYWGMAWDADPTSPTYIGGNFGDVCLTITTKDVASVQQAIDYALNQLSRHKGLSEIVRMSLIANAAHEEGDVIRVERERAGIANEFVMDSFSVPFGTDGVMNATTEASRILTTASA